MHKFFLTLEKVIMMNYFIQQSITIHTIKIGGITNSSVFQIGSSGIIKPNSYLYNTGGFTESAPSVTEESAPFTGVNVADDRVVISPSVPLTGP